LSAYADGRSATLPQERTPLGVGYEILCTINDPVLGGQAQSGKYSNMFFGLSKIFWTLVQPLNALCLLGLLGLLVRLKWDLHGQRLMNFALISILALGLLPAGPLLVTWLERQYPTPAELPQKIDGIILLGGAFESHLTMKTGHIVANDQVDRVFCFVDIAKKHPEAKLVYSGGAGDIMSPDAMEGDDARAFFKLVGLGERKIFYEEKSRNTYENVLYTMEMTDPKAKENWIVATSAYHMPRSMGIFKAFEWNVIPYQCDPRTNGTYNVFSRLPNITGNFVLLNIALKEIIGSVVYYMTGKSAYLLPSAPKGAKS